MQIDNTAQLFGKRCCIEQLTCCVRCTGTRCCVGGKDLLCLIGLSTLKLR